MAQEELQESKLTKAGGRKPTHGCNYPMVGWPSVILTPMGPSLNLTREGTSRPSLRSSLSLSHEVCNTPNLPTECCCPNAHLPARRIPARTTLAHCSICSRRYHIDCLPLTHRPAREILEEDVTTGWTCIECNRDQYATKGLPLDIRHYNVHWKPSRESESDLIAHNPVVAEMIAAYRLQQAAAANDRSPATPALGELAQA